jgi:hypothetical protein
MIIMWYPANSKVGLYPIKNYNNNISITFGTRNQNFINAVKATNKRGKRLGDKTSFGRVFELGDDHRFVLKIMSFKEKDSLDSLKIFLNEVRVGTLPGIQKVGPKIYAFKILKRHGTAVAGMYIMDNFMMGDPTTTVLPFKNWAKMCPQKSDPFWKSFRETLLSFWRITKGYHGDLHTGNLMVVIKNGVPSVRIFDYGSHKKFKTPTNESTCFEDFIHIIDKEYYNKVRQLGKISYFPKETKIRVSWPKRSQPYRPNTNLLRGSSIKGPIYDTKFKKSLMNYIHPINKNKKLNNLIKVRMNSFKAPRNAIIKNLKIRKNRKTIEPKNFFMSPKTFNKINNFFLSSGK